MNIIKTNYHHTVRGLAVCCHVNCETCVNVYLFIIMIMQSDIRDAH